MFFTSCDSFKAKKAKVLIHNRDVSLQLTQLVGFSPGLGAPVMLPRPRPVRDSGVDERKLYFSWNVEKFHQNIRTLWISIQTHLDINLESVESARNLWGSSQFRIKTFLQNLEGLQNKRAMSFGTCDYSYQIIKVGTRIAQYMVNRCIRNLAMQQRRNRLDG